MPRLLDTRARADELALAMAVLIRRDGLTPPATRAIAREVGISVGTLAHHFATRGRLVGVLSHRIARQYVDEQMSQAYRLGVAGLFPAPDDHDLGLLLRARLALDELGRASAPIAASARWVVDEERALLAGLRRGDPEPRRVVGDEEVAAAALLAGLRTAMFRADAPLEQPVAVAAMRQELGRRTASPAA